VNWDTTKKTSGFTAVNGVGYFCDTTSAAFTMTLPATPSAGDIVALKDYANTFDTNNLTVGRNGSNINGSASNAIISVQGQSLTLIYIDTTQGWSAIYGATDADLPVPGFVAATGGTVLTCGDFKTHVFTGPGTFCVSSAGNAAGSNSVEYLVVAGGGGAGGEEGGGGGAGGFRQNYPSPTSAGLPVTATSYPITIGSGGAGRTISPCGPGVVGNNSIFSTITSAGGGFSGGCGAGNTGGSGGSGGGGGGDSSSSADNAGGSGNTPPVSPSQGNNGGSGKVRGSPAGEAGGGGGGAGGVGTNAGANTGGNGGVGSPIATTFFGPTAPSYGTPGPAPGRYFAGGGGGGTINNCGTIGTGGAGGGGNGQKTSPIPSVAGTVNTGGGGGGGGGNSGSGGCAKGAAGGSGIVVIRYKFQ
jgi:hypothetical protein